jgi:hypothetical protein
VALPGAAALEAGTDAAGLLAVVLLLAEVRPFAELLLCLLPLAPLPELLLLCLLLLVALLVRPSSSSTLNEYLQQSGTDRGEHRRATLGLDAWTMP